MPKVKTTIFERNERYYTGLSTFLVCSKFQTKTDNLLHYYKHALGSYTDETKGRCLCKWR